MIKGVDNIYIILIIQKKEILENIRGGQKVESSSPENSVNVLEKFGQDITQLAKDGELDPVIGRRSAPFSAPGLTIVVDQYVQLVFIGKILFKNLIGTSVSCYITPERLS